MRPSATVTPRKSAKENTRSKACDYCSALHLSCKPTDSGFGCERCQNSQMTCEVTKVRERGKACTRCCKKKISCRGTGICTSCVISGVSESCTIHENKMGATNSIILNVLKEAIKQNPSRNSHLEFVYYVDSGFSIGPDYQTIQNPKRLMSFLRDLPGPISATLRFPPECISSINALSQVLNFSNVCQVLPRSIDPFHDIMARFERYQEMMREIDDTTNQSLHSTPWNINISSDSTHDIKLATKNIFKEVNEQIRNIIHCKFLGQVKIHTPIFTLEGQMKLEDIKKYLKRAIQRNTSQKLTTLSKSMDFKNDERIFAREDAIEIKDKVLDICGKYVSIWLCGMYAVNILRDMGSSSAEIESVLKERPFPFVVEKYYQEDEIPYSLDWLEYWYPVYYVEKWNSDWPQHNIFTDKSVCLREKDVRQMYTKKYIDMLKEPWRGVSWDEITHVTIFYG